MRGEVTPPSRPSLWALARGFYVTDIVQRGKEPELLLMLAFLLTFGAVRLVTYSIRYDWLPVFQNMVVGGTHVHHMVPGMLLVLVTGFLSLAMSERRPTRLLAVLFGVGAALVMDEFALWLRLDDVYWEPQGRQSVDAVILTTALMMLYVLELQFWGHLIRILVGRIRRREPRAAQPAEGGPSGRAA
jgi:hypothetical protein